MKDILHGDWASNAADNDTPGDVQAGDHEQKIEEGSLRGGVTLWTRGHVSG
jgi:hypothetical protein